MFATEGRYKREAYRASEFAPRILAEHGLQVVMKVNTPFLSLCAFLNKFSRVITLCLIVDSCSMKRLKPITLAFLLTLPWRL